MSKYPSLASRLLDTIENTGNRIPHPALLFIYLAIGVALLSWLAARLGWHAVHPVSGETISAFNLLSRAGVHRVLEQTVSNFTHFAPVGTVLVAMLGIGIADHAGLLSAIMRSLVLRAPERALTFTVVFAGVLSSLAADAGYVVLIPLAAALFQAAGRPPLAGIAAAFAGVSAGYSANLIIGPLDAMLAGISTEAAALVDPERTVSPAANYYFMAGSTLLIAALATWVTERIVQPRLARHTPQTATESSLAPPLDTLLDTPLDRPMDKPLDTLAASEARALRAVAWFSVLFVILLVLGVTLPHGLLRADHGTVLDGPFIGGIVTIIAFYFALAGTLFGYISGTFKRSSDVINSMEAAMASMAGYLVLMFFAAQFVSYFAWTELGLICAIKGAELLRTVGTDGNIILLLFVLLAAAINLLVGSASAKWSIIAPVFVPMFMLYGIPPEATQVAYRIGDSSTNIITPLMPYFGIIVAFAQRYDPQAGIGTIVAMMLPYSATLLLGWSAILALWLLAGWPLGA